MRCDLCGADDYVVLFERSDARHDVAGLYRMVQCQTCELLYLNPRPSEETLTRHYPEDYAPFDVSRGLLGRVTRVLRRREADGTRAWIPDRGRVLELGCAAGDLLLPLRTAGFDVVGVEPSASASRRAREQYGLPVHTGTLASAELPSGTFDAVVIRSVIEHLPSPVADLRRIAALLKPGGHLFITTDNADSTDRRAFGQDWYGFDVPRHLNVFSSKTLTRALTSANFTVRRISYSIVPNHWVVSSRYLLERRLGKSWMTAALSLRSPVLLAAFMPITLLQRALGSAGRMSLVAVRAEVPR